jgi:hypothetical protein
MSCAITVFNIAGFIPTAEEAKQATPYNVSESEAIRYCDHLHYALEIAEAYGTSQETERILYILGVFALIWEEHRDARNFGTGLALDLC